MDYSTRGSSVFDYLQEFAHIQVHWVGDANYTSLQPHGF